MLYDYDNHNVVVPETVAQQTAKILQIDKTLTENHHEVYGIPINNREWISQNVLTVICHYIYVN